jgi:hypothetical protein
MQPGREVEHKLAKVEVEDSNPFARSKFPSRKSGRYLAWPSTSNVKPVRIALGWQKPAEPA